MACNVPERLRPEFILRGPPTAAPYVRDTCRRTPEPAGGGDGTLGGFAKCGESGEPLAWDWDWTSITC